MHFKNPDFSKEDGKTFSHHLKEIRPGRNLSKSLPEQRRIVAYMDELQVKVDALRRLKAETGTELDALLPAVLDKAFKGEL